MTKRLGLKNATEGLLILLGTFFIIVSINVFFSPNRIITGGFTGIAIIIQEVTQPLIAGGIPKGISNFVLNLPLFAVAYAVLGRDYFWRAFFTNVVFSIGLEVFTFLPTYQGDFLLAALYGGIFDGVGVGLVLRGLSGTGGVDLLGAIIHRLKPHLPVSGIMFVCNAVIILTGFFVFGAERTMYGILAVFVISKVVDMVLEGLSFSKAAFIISEKNMEIAKEIMQRQNRGVTGLNGVGMYTGKEKQVLLCVFRQKEIAMMKNIIRQVDPKAFLILTDVKDVLGNGFKSLEELD